MAAIDWPTTLPAAPAINGFTRTPRDNRIISTNDDGPPKMRRRSTVSGYTYAVVFELTTTEIGYLETFWHDTLNGGTEIFDWTDPLSGSTVEVSMPQLPTITPNGDGGTEWLASMIFESMPS